MMRERKLYDLLRRLDPQERKLFAEFLRSPLHAHRPKLADLVMQMEEMLFEKPDKEVSNETFYAALYPGKPFDSNNLNRLISVITAEFKSYMALLHYKKDKAAEIGNLVREYRHRRWDDITAKEITNARARLKEETVQDENYYYYMAAIEVEQAILTLDNLPKNPGPIFQAAMDAFDSLYCYIKLKLNAFSIPHDRIHNTQHLNRGNDYIDECTGDKSLAPSLTLELYKKAYQITKGEVSDLDFQEFRSKIQTVIPNYHDIESVKRISLFDAESLYNAAILHVVKNFTAGNKKDFDLYRELWEESVEKGTNLDNGYLKPRSYVDYSRQVAIRSGLEPALSAIEKFNHFLPPLERHFSSALAIGMSYFFVGTYDPAKKHLNIAKNALSKTTDPMLNLECRAILCTIYLALGDLHDLEYETQSLRSFLNRDQGLPLARLASYNRLLQVSSSALTSLQKPRPLAQVRLIRLLEKIQAGKKFALRDYIVLAIKKHLE